MQVSIDENIANKYGLDSAFIVGSFRASIAAKKKKPENYKAHFHDGHFWAFASAKKLSEEYPFLGCPRSIKAKLKRLVDDGILITGVFNKKAYDKTLWYRLADQEPIQEIDHDKMENSAPGFGKICPTQVKNLPHALENSAPRFGKICPTYTNSSSSYSSTISSASSSLDAHEEIQIEKKQIRIPRNQIDFQESVHKSEEAKPSNETEQLVSELEKLGITRWQAENLVLTHRCEAVRNQLDWLKYRNSDNHARTICASLAGNWEPPAIIEKELKKKQEQQAKIEEMERIKKENLRAEKERLEAIRAAEEKKRKEIEAMTPEQLQAHKEMIAAQKRALDEKKRADMKAAREKIEQAKQRGQRFTESRFRTAPNQNDFIEGAM